MPCRDYDDAVRYLDNTRTYQEQRDKLARIACRAMALLEKNGIKLDNKEANDWYRQHKIDDAREEARAVAAQEAKERKERLRKSALSKLTPAERKELGIK